MKILVIRFQAIGDVMLTSVICNTLKRSFPDSQLDYMVYEVSAPLFDYHPYIDNVISVSPQERKNPFRYFKKLRKIAKSKYDIIIDANSTGKSELVCLFSRHAKFRIGREKKHRGIFYTHKVPLAELQGDKIEQRLQLLIPLEKAGLPIKWGADMCVALTKSDKQHARQLLDFVEIDANRPLIIFSVSSREPQKQWRRDYMKRVAEHCLEVLNAQIVLYFGALHEQEEVGLFHRELNWHGDVVSSIKTSNLRELAALMSHCDMFVGNECGPRHIAQALKVPSVAIFSPSAEKSVWLPSQSDRYQGVEWQDVEGTPFKEKGGYEFGDTEYYRRYNSITPSHVIPLVDHVFEKYVRPKTRLCSENIDPRSDWMLFARE